MMLHGIWARGSKCVAAHKDKKGQRWAVPLWFLVLFIGVLNSCAPFFLLFHYLFLFFLLVQMKDHFLPQNSKIMYVEMGWILIILFWSKTNHMTLWGVLSHSLWLEVSSYVQPHDDILESGVPTMKTQWRCKNHTKEISITILFCFCRPRDWEEGEGALMIKMALSRILILGGM